MNYLGSITDRPDTFAAFFGSHWQGVLACIVLASAAALVKNALEA